MVAESKAPWIFLVLVKKKMSITQISKKLSKSKNFREISSKFSHMHAGKLVHALGLQGDGFGAKVKTIFFLF